MAANRANIEIWKTRLRRKFAVDLAGLAALADAAADEAGEVVTFTQTTVEGGSAAGVVTGNKLEIMAAAEELLADPLFSAGITARRPRVIIPDFRTSSPV